MVPHLCESSGTGLVFRCLEDELCEWEEEDGARLFWISCLQNNREWSIIYINYIYTRALNNE